MCLIFYLPLFVLFSSSFVVNTSTRNEEESIMELPAFIRNILGH
jgi:hypothetical protein